MRDITNYDDVIDSRDIISRIRELQDEGEEPEGLSEEDEYELHNLLKLQEEAEGSPDWNYGETLIRDSYFADYARELAEDCGMISEDSRWPVSHIDWDSAAGELKQDYFSVDFDGVDYWVRA